MTNPTSGADKEDGKEEQNHDDEGPESAFRFMCQRKRCERHRLWQKVAMSDLKCEAAAVEDEIQRLEAEEQDIRERAIIRYRQTRNGTVNGGTVEVIGVN